jgi:hypothetical protein
MICPKCGNNNRPGARFCKQCGAVMERAAPAPPPQVTPARPPSPPVSPPTVPSPPLSLPTVPSPPLPPRPVPSQPAAPWPPVAPPAPPLYAPAPVPPVAQGSGGAGRVIGGIGLFGGYILAVLGALAALGAFVLPWFPTGDTGLDTVSKALQPGGDQMFLLWGLVPLGALVLLLLSLVGVVLGFLGKGRSSGLALLLPLLVALPGLCGCLPLSSPVITSLMNTGFDVNRLSGELAGLGNGFWIAMAGLGIALVGVLAALVGGLLRRR